MKQHGNSHDNQEPHHLYEIRDGEREEVYKFGISGEPILPDGSSPRANRQVRAFNRLVGEWRFFANMLLTEIEGRKRAEELEEKAAADHEIEHGKRPRGNPPKTFSPHQNKFS